MLELTRRIGYENARMQAGEPWQTTIGLDLDGLTLGVARPRQARHPHRADRQGVRHEGRSPGARTSRRKKLQEAGVDYVSKEDLFRQADFVTIHVVLSQRSRGLVGASEIRR